MRLKHAPPTSKGALETRAPGGQWRAWEKLRWSKRSAKAVKHAHRDSSQAGATHPTMLCWCAPVTASVVARHTPGGGGGVGTVIACGRADD